MKKLISALILSLLFTTFGISQDYSVEWGPSYKKDGGLFSSNRLMGIYDNHYYSLSTTRKGSTLLKFDMSHKLVSNKSISKKYEGEKIYFSKFVDTKNGTFGYMPQVVKKKWRMLVSKFDGNDFGEIKEIYSHDFERKRISLYGMGINADASNKLIVSMDKSKVAFTNILSMKEKNTEETMAVAVFDADLKIQWEKKQKFGYKDKGIKIKQTVIDENGVVYVLAVISDKAKKIGKKLKKDKDKAKHLPKYDYSIFRITENDMKEFKVELKDPTIAPIDIAMYFPEKGTEEMIVSGFYTDSERKSGIKGVFYASGNGNDGIKNIKTDKFEDEFIEDLVSRRALKKDRGLSSSYNIDHFIHFANGEIGFVAEHYYVTSHTTTDAQGRTRTSYTYHSNTLIIPRFSKDGDLLNIQKVKKRFSSSSPAIVSYAMAVVDGKTYFVFNDFKSKDEISEMKGKRRWRYTDMVVLDEKNEIEFNETLFNSKEIDLTFIPSMSDYSSNVIILGSMSRKKYAFGTLRLK